MNPATAQENISTYSWQRKIDEKYKLLLEEYFTGSVEENQAGKWSLSLQFFWPIIAQYLSIPGRYAYLCQRYIFRIAGKVLKPTIIITQRTVASFIAISLGLFLTKGANWFWSYTWHGCIWLIYHIGIFLLMLSSAIAEVPMQIVDGTRWSMSLASTFIILGSLFITFYICKFLLVRMLYGSAQYGSVTS